MWPAHSADSSGLLVVSNVKMRMEAQRSVPPQSLWLVMGKLCLF